MSNQSHLHRAIRLVTALMLLAAVMTSPIRPAIAVYAGGSSHVEYLRRDFGVPGKASTTHHRPHTPATSRVVQVKALSSHRELDWTSDCVHHHVDLLDGPSVESGRHATALGLDHTTRPLRC
jgi:hypothetical protein